MKSMTTVVYVMVGVGLFVSFIGWSDEHTREVNQAAIAYEQCVQTEYGMTPIQWYEQHHQYPLCGN